MNEIADNLINQAAEGDHEAFETIYKVCSSFVLNVAYRIVGNREDAEEVTQDVFLVIYKKLKGFRFDSSLKTWIYRITVNASINYAKKANRQRKRNVPFNEQFSAIEQANQIRQEADKEFHQRVAMSLLNALNPDQRACIVLRSVEKLRYQEIAEALNININTVRTRIKRARESLLALREEVVKNAM